MVIGSLSQKQAEEPCRMRGFENPNGRSGMSLTTEQLLKAEVGEGSGSKLTGRVEHRSVLGNSEVNAKAHVSTKSESLIQELL